MCTLSCETNSLVSKGTTNSTGRYAFYGLVAGRFKIAVLPYDLPYQDRSRTSNSLALRGRHRGGISTDLTARSSIILNCGQAVLGPKGRYLPKMFPRKHVSYTQGICQILITRMMRLPSLSYETRWRYFRNTIRFERLGNEYIRLRHYEAAAILLAMPRKSIRILTPLVCLAYSNTS